MAKSVNPILAQGLIYPYVKITVTNIVSANISPRVQKEIVRFIGKNVGKHRQYIDKIKNTKYKKIQKKEKNHSIVEKIAKYRQTSANIVIKYANIARKSGKIAKKNRENIGAIFADFIASELTSRCCRYIGDICNTDLDNRKLFF